MADLFIPPGYASIACRFAIAGQSGFRSITMGIDTSSGPVSTQDCCDDLKTALAHPTHGLFAATMFSGISAFAEVYMLRNVAGNMQAAITPVNRTGLRSGSTQVTPNVSLTLKKRTAFVGKKFRGRSYLPNNYILEADVDNGGVIDGARVSALNTAAAETLADLSSADLPMVLLHSESPLVPNLITSWVSSTIIATQRRRITR